MEQALTDIESGRADQLEGVYPTELSRLTSNINSLIRHAQARQQRYRDSLGDLAHSLKTPLAILQVVADKGSNSIQNSQVTVREQVDRMNQIVSHQLQRAAASGRNILTQSVLIEPVVERLVNSLDKVYLEKGIQWQLSVVEESCFRGEEGDLMELLGNLMENACKYGSGRVHVSAQMDEYLHISVEDDGKGIPDDKAEAVLQRWHRIDLQQPGQGIGLAVAADIVSAYGGRLEISHSEALGGVAIHTHLPVG